MNACFILTIFYGLKPLLKGSNCFPVINRLRWENKSSELTELYYYYYWEHECPTTLIQTKNRRLSIKSPDWDTKGFQIATPLLLFRGWDV